MKDDWVTDSYKRAILRVILALIEVAVLIGALWLFTGWCDTVSRAQFQTHRVLYTGGLIGGSFAALTVWCLTHDFFKWLVPSEGVSR